MTIFNACETRAYCGNTLGSASFVHGYVADLQQVFQEENHFAYFSTNTLTGSGLEK
jgi:hypothetical protein